MVTSAHSNTKTVEQGTHIEMMDVAYEETNHGILLLSLAKKPHPLDGAQLLHTIMCEVTLMRRDAVKTDALNIIDSNSQSVRGDVVRRARLELQWGTLKGGAPETHCGNHLSPTLIRRHAVEPLLASV